jgi:antitoxin (DNA-binding transcriptional repressor) of toxin-antitoxin stability system
MQLTISAVTIHAVMTDLSKLLAWFEAGGEIMIAPGKTPIAPSAAGGY